MNNSNFRDAFDDIFGESKNSSKASALSLAAKKMLEDIENLLQHVTNEERAFEIDRLKCFKQFEAAPASPQIPSPPYPVEIPEPPDPNNNQYLPQSGWNKFMNYRPGVDYRKKSYAEDYDDWSKKKELVENFNQEKEAQYKSEVERIKRTHSESTEKWLKQKAEFLLIQGLHNRKCEVLKKSYFDERSPDAITEYNKQLLLQSVYPFQFERKVEMQYIAETKMLVLNYQLPTLADIPTLKEVRFVRARDEYKYFHLSNSAKNKLYDDTLYRISLKTLWEVFIFDKISAIDSVVFNGWVKSIDSGTGLPIQPCILSIQAIKESFLKLDLRYVSPKECFRKLQGVGSSALYDLAAVRPIVTMNMEDKRFVEGRAIVDGLNDSTNIAGISWEDFEHLIRELFEKEFARGGGEVKVTQASRDGGVDAVAFDPDPIRGGKIVIQAKRYTNTVGVSAVRDLYGTVVSEGATKGILITTAEYGKDSYEFAKGKPLTLLNGGHLLYLLKRHGYSARIDLAEAKKLNDQLNNRNTN